MTAHLGYEKHAQEWRDQFNLSPDPVAAEHGTETVEAIEEGLREKAEESREKGGELYVEAGD